jgi:hypothetical protein
MIDFTKDSEYIRMYGKKEGEMFNFKGANIVLDKIMRGADASINIGIKLISLAIVLQIVFGHSVPFLGGNVIGTIIGIIGQLGSAGLVGLIATLVIWRLLDDDIRKELSE